MTRKDLSRVERRTVESAVAKRYPYLPLEDQQRYASLVVDYIADAISTGGTPAFIIPRADGDVDLDYLTIEKILDGDR